MTLPEEHFPIVGIGASAGGLKAIEEMLRHLPPDTGMGFVIIQHLSRRFKSLMQEILMKDTKMPIVMAEEGMPIHPNRIHLIPAGQTLTVNNRLFTLEDLSEKKVPHFVIDKFLHSLGQDIEAQAIAVILSGTGTDGSRGIKTIKEAGGIVMVQEVLSAEFDGMPLSAIDSKIVDFVLPPKGIAAQLAALSRLGISSPQLSQRQAEQDLEASEVDRTLKQILELVRIQHQVDFLMYKPHTIRRRIEKQMAALQVQELEQYYNALLSDNNKVDTLFQELLIGVTEFFRDPEAYEALNKEVFPRLFASKSKAEEFRIWHCGCSTGEEVYSVAIALYEYAEKIGATPHLTILATDVDNKALAKAGRAIYSTVQVSGLSEDLLYKYFEPKGNGYEIKDFVRDKVIFARNDATVDPPFINLDLVVCRNLLIYLRPQVQSRLLSNFHFGLKPGRFLWLGTSENILDFKSNFSPLSDKWRVFQATGVSANNRKPPLFQTSSAYRRPTPSVITPTQSIEDRIPPRNARVFFAKLLLDRFASPCALFDHQFQLLYLAGGAGRFLEVPDLDLRNDLLSMVQGDLVFLLRDGVRRLQDGTGPLVYTNFTVNVKGKDIPYDIAIDVLPVPGGDNVYLLEWRQQAPDSLPPIPEGVEVKTPNLEADAKEVILGLQSELNIARQEVQNSMEELSTINEEIQAANEELIASNEELQSTNEELQSVNEELYTVNSELQARNRELADANATVDNLLNSTGIGTLFLDRDFNIRWFTPAFTQVCPLTLSDIGTNIDKFLIKWNYDVFLDDARNTMKTGMLREIEVKGLQHDPEDYYLVRLNPYQQQGQIKGVVVNLVDITLRKNAQLQVQQSVANLHRILDTMPTIVSIIKPDGTFVYINRTEGGYQPQDVIGSNMFDYLPDAENLEIVREALARAVARGGQSFYESQSTSADGSMLKYQNYVVPLMTPDGQVYEFLIASVNATANILERESIQLELQTFQKIVENPRVLITLKDDKLRYMRVNQGFLNLLHKPESYILGNNDYALFSQETADAFRRHDEQLLEQDTPHLQLLETFTHNGRSAQVCSIRQHMQMPDGQSYILQIGIPWDDTPEAEEEQSQEAHYWEQEMEARTKDLLQANQELRAITRSMAHDMRGPVRAIRSFSQLMREENPDQPHLDTILRQTDRLAKIIDDLLAYAKIGSQDIRKELVDLQNLAEDIWQDLSYLRNGEESQLIFRHLPPIWADMGLLRQILTNLLSNALKYQHPDRPCQIEIGAHRDSRIQQIVYFVKDNGIGFDQKQAEKVFGVFERLPEARAIDGSGIGLSIVKKAVELQGGSIWVHAQLGEGATFYLHLPAKTS